MSCDQESSPDEDETHGKNVTFADSKFPSVPPPMKEPESDIEDKILRRREMAHLFQWYYPEGGWGWVVLVCACLSQALAVGFQMSFAHPLSTLIKERFLIGQEGGYWGNNFKMGKPEMTNL